MGVKHGFGHHVWDIPHAEVSTVIMYDYLTQAFGVAASCMGRISFIFYILGLLGIERLHRIILLLFISFQLTTNVVSILIMFLQCPGHASDIWGRPRKAGCWDVHVQAYYGYFQGAFNSATDLYLAAFPAYILWNMNMDIRLKLGVIMLLGLGVL
ncbi:hypothetical protein N7474_008659 [Penicillium riverlandense]|uniref:uncharacterized protein n=1 Tax=Penicillium riverlandense TaxID=1903569 RepID=UPI0025476C96|nr:uncharacterized protein N7474_008659 [Penicillium riverlandense]KAJ5812358.1 hypothetical protein N7474_008659 [Penicillium riverlandense]